jgi:hypothetical protein
MQNDCALSGFITEVSVKLDDPEQESCCVFSSDAGAFLFWEGH